MAVPARRDRPAGRDQRNCAPERALARTRLLVTTELKRERDLVPKVVNGNPPCASHSTRPLAERVGFGLADAQALVVRRRHRVRVSCGGPGRGAPDKIAQFSHLRRRHIAPMLGSIGAGSEPRGPYKRTWRDRGPRPRQWRP